MRRDPYLQELTRLQILGMCVDEVEYFRKQMVSGKVDVSGRSLFGHLTSSVDERHFLNRKIDFLDRLLSLLETNEVGYCSIAITLKWDRQKEMEIEWKEEFINLVRTVLFSVRKRKRMTDADCYSYVAEIDHLKLCRVSYQLGALRNECTLGSERNNDIQALLIESRRNRSKPVDLLIKLRLKAIAYCLIFNHVRYGDILRKRYIINVK